MLQEASGSRLSPHLSSWQGSVLGDSNAQGELREQPERLCPSSAQCPMDVHMDCHKEKDTAWALGTLLSEHHSDKQL